MLNFSNRGTWPFFVVIVLLILPSCMSREGMQKEQDELLRDLGVNDPADFAALSTCEQVKVFAEVGSTRVDIDHMTSIVPTWMDEELAKQPREDLAECIVSQANEAFMEWEQAPTNQRADSSYRIHALLYKANELDLLEYPEVERLFQRAICEDKIRKNGQLIIIDYLYRFPGDYPPLVEMEKALCMP